MEKTKYADLTDEEKEILRKHHEDKRKALLAELSKVDSKIQSYGGINKPKNQTSLPFPKEFKKAKSVPAKVIYIIKEFGQQVTFQEIIEKYSEYDPSIKKDGAFIKKKYAHIYSALITKVKTGQITKHQETGSFLKFGLAEWIK